jgi:hypothetical protein
MCRLWRLVLLQAEAGFWDPLPSVAFALHAHDVAPPRTARSYSGCGALRVLGTKAACETARLLVEAQLSFLEQQDAEEAQYEDVKKQLAGMQVSWGEESLLIMRGQHALFSRGGRSGNMGGRGGGRGGGGYSSHSSPAPPAPAARQPPPPAQPVRAPRPQPPPPPPPAPVPAAAPLPPPVAEAPARGGGGRRGGRGAEGGSLEAAPASAPAPAPATAAAPAAKPLAKAITLAPAPSPTRATAPPPRSAAGEGAPQEGAKGGAKGVRGFRASTAVAAPK